MPLPLLLIGPAALLATGYGVKKGYDAYQKNSTAEELMSSTKKAFSKSQYELKRANAISLQSLDKLGHLQLQIGAQFNEFKTIAQHLLEKLNKASEPKELILNLPKNRLAKIDDVSISAGEFLGKMAVGAGAGVAAGYAVYGGVMGMAAAYTGMPIAAFAGAFGQNLMVAAVGGGAVGAGGIGGIGGIIIGGAAVAPALMAVGVVLDNVAEKKLEEVQECCKKAHDAIDKMNMGRGELEKIINTVDEIYSSLSRLNQEFLVYLNKLKAMEILNYDINLEKALNTIRTGLKIAGILAKIITTPLFKLKKENGEIVVNEDKSVQFETNSAGIPILNKDEIDAALVASKDKMSKFSN